VRGEPATRVLETLRGSPRNTAFVTQITVEIASAFGHIETALDLLDESLRRGLFDVGWMDRCPSLGAIRTEPRFVEARVEVAARAKRIVDAYLSTDP
jgi:eukaryotic-like serine/threonine-protein kinase